MEIGLAKTVYGVVYCFRLVMGVGSEFRPYNTTLIWQW